ncbi:MAG: hypothetical protein IT579_12430, partial [Verrucomicrobia subdivision 3 bacterium]|nr:hypothetical protein [Limisphaerales bacterium]
MLHPMLLAARRKIVSGLAHAGPHPCTSLPNTFLGRPCRCVRTGVRLIGNGAHRVTRPTCSFAVAIGLLCVAFLGLPSSGFTAAPKKPAARTVIREENAKAGALDWQLTRVRVDKNEFRSPLIEGYCSRQSVKAGES